MKQAIKFSLLGAIVGAVLMLTIVLIMDKKPSHQLDLETQVINYLEHEGIQVDTIYDHLYSFWIEEDRYIFDYSLSDPVYLKIFAGFGLDEYTYDEVAAACVDVMSSKRNCIMIPEETDRGVAVRISCENFVSGEDALDTKIVIRSIWVIHDAWLHLAQKLCHLEDDIEGSNAVESIGL